MPFPISREIEYFDIQWEHLKRICSPDPTDPPPPVDPDPPADPPADPPPPAAHETVRQAVDRHRKPVQSHRKPVN
jgi:hypothetical protein